MSESAVATHETRLELREQFATPEQQRQTATIGMWIFLVTEVLLFGGLFTAFTVYRLSHPAAFDAASAHMEILLGAINTGVLICSSFTMAMAVYNAEIGNQKLLILFLLATMAIGALFLGIKFTEYYDHFRDHKVPALWFNYTGPHAPEFQMFFVFYFIMTGLHAVHMTIGIGLLSVITFRAVLGSFTADYYTPVELSGLYWHFIDIVWVFLYAIFYISGLHLR